MQRQAYIRRGRVSSAHAVHVRSSCAFTLRAKPSDALVPGKAPTEHKTDHAHTDMHAWSLREMTFTDCTRMQYVCLREHATPHWSGCRPRAMAVAHGDHLIPLTVSTHRLYISPPRPCRYQDQPQVVVRSDGGWSCVLTLNSQHEGQNSQRVVSTVSTDEGLTWSPLVDVEPHTAPPGKVPLSTGWINNLLVPATGRIYAFYTCVVSSAAY